MTESPAPVRVDIDLPGRGMFSQLRWGDDPAKPLLHFAHATGFNAATYQTVLGPLAAHFRIWATDLRGHGFTTAKADPATLKVWTIYADDLAALLGTVDEPVCLSGHSMGGAISLLCAARQPDKVAGLVLVDPVLIPPLAIIHSRLRRFLGLKPTTPLIEGARRRRPVFASRDAMVDAYTGRGAFATWPVEVIRDYVNGGTRDREDGQVELTCAPAWEAATFQSAGSLVGGMVKQITCPVTILQAEHFSTLRGGMAAMLRRRQPGWRIDQVPGTSHFLPMEKPDVVRAVMMDVAGLQQAD